MTASGKRVTEGSLFSGYGGLTLGVASALARVGLVLEQLRGESVAA